MSMFMEAISSRVYSGAGGTLPHQIRVVFPIVVMAAAMTLGWSQPAAAQSSDVYMCKGAGGVPEYRNGNPGNSKDCRRLNLPDVVTVPGGARSGGASGGSGGKAPATSPATFPRVDSATQKSRDGERRTVLETELQTEEAKLAGLRADYNNGEPERQGGERNYQKYLDRVAQMRDDIARSEANVASLRRELSGLKE